MNCRETTQPFLVYLFIFLNSYLLIIQTRTQIPDKVLKANADTFNQQCLEIF